MNDPFKIDGPTCISFSGGRTSAYMLWRVLQSNGGLPVDAIVIFANTGKEDEATLRFVRDCSAQWGTPITWVEYRPDGEGFAIVDFHSASRNGEPFDALIERKQFLPSPMQRFCTAELKVFPAVAVMHSLGHNEHDNLIGMRADEPDRVARVRANPSGGVAGVDRRVPLASIGIGKHDIAKFWRAQPFDLGLPLVAGRTLGGNCDLCFNKPPFERLALIKEKPARAVWWMGHEQRRASRFTKDGPSYEQMSTYAAEQRDMFDHNEEAIACFCGD